MSGCRLNKQLARALRATLHKALCRFFPILSVEWMTCERSYAGSIIRLTASAAHGQPRRISSLMIDLPEPDAPVMTNKFARVGSPPLLVLPLFGSPSVESFGLFQQPACLIDNTVVGFLC